MASDMASDMAGDSVGDMAGDSVGNFVGDTVSNTRLLQAYARGDAAEIIRIYSEAGRAALGSGDIPSGCFLITQAYIYSLEIGAPEAQELREVLVAHGREVNDE